MKPTIEFPAAPIAFQTGETFLREAWLLIRRRLRLMAVLALLTAGLVIIAGLQMRPIYTSSARVMLDAREKRVTNVDEVLSNLPSDVTVVDTQVEVIRSRNNIRRVVQSLALTEDPEFNPTLRPQSLMGSLSSAGRGLINLFTGGRPSTAEPSAVEAQVIDAVAARLGVSRVRMTYVFEVSFSAHDPVKAARIANAITRQYVVSQLEAKFDATKQANEWLNSRLVELRDQVRTAEQAVERFKAENGLLAAVGSSLTEQQIAQVGTDLSQAQVELAERRARLATAQEQMRAGGTGEAMGEALASDVMRDLRSQRAVVSRELADLDARLGPKHPRRLQKAQELLDVDGQIRAQLGRIIANLQAEVDVAEQRVSALRASLSQNRGVLASNNRASVRLRELERDAEAVRTLYESFLARFKETETQKELQEPEARVIASAEPPRAPSAPNMRFVALIGILSGIAVGLLGALAAEMLEQTLRTRDQVRRLLQTNYLGQIPQMRTIPALAHETAAPYEVVVSRQLSVFAESFRGLAAALVRNKADRKVQVIAITSAVPGEGKSTTAACLGRIMAIGGQRVCIVDTDVRRRQLSLLLTKEPKAGLIELLDNRTTLDEALVKDERTEAVILPVRASEESGRTIFTDQAMQSLMSMLRARFDVIILDTAPIIPVAMSRLIVPYADSVLVLIKWGDTPATLVRNAVEIVREAGGPLAGVAFSQVDVGVSKLYGAEAPYAYPGAYSKDYS
jgi:capsular exopolysaccharide synthesis family protein